MSANSNTLVFGENKPNYSGLIGGTGRLEGQKNAGTDSTERRQSGLAAR